MWPQTFEVIVDDVEAMRIQANWLAYLRSTVLGTAFLGASALKARTKLELFFDSDGLQWLYTHLPPHNISVSWAIAEHDFEALENAISCFLDHMYKFNDGLPKKSDLLTICLSGNVVDDVRKKLRKRAKPHRRKG